MEKHVKDAAANEKDAEEKIKKEEETQKKREAQLKRKAILTKILTGCATWLPKAFGSGDSGLNGEQRRLQSSQR